MRHIRPRSGLRCSHRLSFQIVSLPLGGGVPRPQIWERPRSVKRLRSPHERLMMRSDGAFYRSGAAIALTVGIPVIERRFSQRQRRIFQQLLSFDHQLRSPSSAPHLHHALVSDLHDIIGTDFLNGVIFHAHSNVPDVDRYVAKSRPFRNKHLRSRAGLWTVNQIAE